MKKIFTIVMAGLCVISTGCDLVRFAPGEVQKQNAWLHNHTSALVAQTAKAEKTSDKLQALTRLSQKQSGAFVAYYGLPKQLSVAESIEDVLSETSFEITQLALQEGGDRPDVFDIAEGALNLSIAIAALFGGVYGTKAVAFLSQARTKSKALQEIISGNEFFKRQNIDQSLSFKQAHKNQSAQTQKIVSQVKADTYT